MTAAALNTARLASAPTYEVHAMWASAHILAAHVMLLDRDFHAKLREAEEHLSALLDERTQEPRSPEPRDRTELSPMTRLSSRAEIP